MGCFNWADSSSIMGDTVMDKNTLEIELLNRLDDSIKDRQVLLVIMSALIGRSDIDSEAKLNRFFQGLPLLSCSEDLVGTFRRMASNLDKQRRAVTEELGQITKNSVLEQIRKNEEAKSGQAG